MKTIIGFDSAEFHEILFVVEDHLEQGGRGRKRLDPPNSLALFLMWACSGITLQKLSLIVAMKKTTIRNTVKRVINCIKIPLVQKFIPNILEDPQNGIKFRYFPDAIGAVDATVVRICRPKDYSTQAFYYCGKHHFHCVKFQLLVRVDGK